MLTHSVGALLHHVFSLPSEGGLGLRRCQWFTTTLNTASQNAGLRMGFKLEGILRNHRVLPAGKEGARGELSANDCRDAGNMRAVGH